MKVLALMMEEVWPLPIFCQKGRLISVPARWIVSLRTNTFRVYRASWLIKNQNFGVNVRVKLHHLSYYHHIGFTLIKIVLSVVVGNILSRVIGTVVLKNPGPSPEA